MSNLITLGVLAQRGYCNRSVCLSVLKLACSKFIRSTNDTACLMHNKGVKFCGIFSVTAPLQSQSPSSIAQLLHESVIFHSTDKCMHILH